MSCFVKSKAFPFFYQENFMNALDILSKMPVAEQQAIQQYCRMELMKKLKSRIVIVGIVKEIALMQKQRENGEPLNLGFVTLADGVPLTMFDPETDLERLKGEEHMFEIGGAREYKGKISYTISEILDVQKVQELLGISNGKPAVTEVSVAPKTVTVAEVKETVETVPEAASKKSSRLPIPITSKG
jgi:hypothetical protein